MDKERQIRFLYPPLIFLCSLAFGAYFDPSNELSSSFSNLIKEENSVSIFVAIIGVSSLVLVIGFLLGTITVFILRILFHKNDWNYEVKLSKNSYKGIGEIILKDKNYSIKKEDYLYLGIIFDHGSLPKNIHQWIVRRWNAFFISSSSAIALFLSLIIGGLFKICIGWEWLFVTIALIAIFILQSQLSWKETMKMIEFMIQVKGTDNLERQNGTNDSGDEDE